MSALTSQGREPRLVIVGRPNVGKSTLFNRLFGRRRALVHDEPGVTRDRLEERAEWWVGARRAAVRLIDTGGLGGERFADEIKKQVDLALHEADVAIVLFDGQAGFTPHDREVLNSLRVSGIENRGVKLIGVVNKVDDEKHEEFINDFYASGLDPLLTISAEHGRGMDELKAAVLAAAGVEGATLGDIADAEAADEERAALEASSPWAEETSEEGAEDEREAPDAPRTRRTPRIAIVGRPNVGKSTLVNSLLGESRMITSPIAGTTVDSIDSITELAGRTYQLIDTAGIRRKSRTEQGVEVLSVVQTRKALERCDVAVLVLDAELGISDQDEKIGGLIEEVGCGVILLINKWDALRRTNPGFQQGEAAKQLRSKMAYLRYAPILMGSARLDEGFEELPILVDEILEARDLKVTTREFTEWVRREAEIHNPLDAKFYLCHQSGRHPPTFVCHVNDPGKIHFSLQRHILNAMREKWGFMGNPMRLLFVKGKNNKKGATQKRRADPARQIQPQPRAKATAPRGLTRVPGKPDAQPARSPSSLPGKEQRRGGRKPRAGQVIKSR